MQTITISNINLNLNSNQEDIDYFVSKCIESSDSYAGYSYNNLNNTVEIYYEPTINVDVFNGIGSIT